MSLTIELQHKIDQFHLSVAFNQPERGVTALFGPSGSGKSLTINMIAGLVQPTTGEIKLNEKWLFSTKNSVNLPPHKRHIGYVFQDSRLFPHKTINQNLLFGAKRAKDPPTLKYQTHIIDMLDIGHLLNRFPSHLSGGEKQRVAIGRALLSQPDLLLLDEPLSALDHRRQGEILSHLETIRDESLVPILLITHSMNEVARLADNVVLLDKGQIAAQGNVHDITSNLNLSYLTGRTDTGSAFDGVVKSHDIKTAISTIEFEGQELYIPLIKKSVGSNIRFRIRARDVLLAKQKPIEISANNILPAKIIDYRITSSKEVDVQLRIGSQILLSQITLRSWYRLGLCVGLDIYVFFKSVYFYR